MTAKFPTIFSCIAELHHLSTLLTDTLRKHGSINMNTLYKLRNLTMLFSNNCNEIIKEQNLALVKIKQLPSIILRLLMRGDLSG